MTLAADYREQFRWRSWSLTFEALPLQPGQTVLDLGCGPGVQARELAFRRCTVIGLDGNRELIDAAIAEAGCPTLVRAFANRVGSDDLHSFRKKDRRFEKAQLQLCRSVPNIDRL